MSGAVYMAASGALLNQMRLEVLANNLANINTAGFKEEKAYFRVDQSPEAVRESLEAVSLSADEPTLPLWQQLESRTVFSQGGLKSTGNPFDLALEGRGFFCVQTPDGVRYTRSGSFVLNAKGELSTPSGFPVLGEGGPLKVEKGRGMQVDEEGGVWSGGVSVGKLRVVDFEQPELLRRMGDTLFEPPLEGALEIEPQRVRISQGFLEGANVEAIRAMTEMIEVLRAYESYQKAIRQLDEMEDKAINEVGRVG